MPGHSNKYLRCKNWSLGCALSFGTPHQKMIHETSCIFKRRHPHPIVVNTTNNPNLFGDVQEDPNNLSLPVAAMPLTGTTAPSHEGDSPMAIPRQSLTARDSLWSKTSSLFTNVIGTLNMGNFFVRGKTVENTKTNELGQKVRFTDTDMVFFDQSDQSKENESTESDKILQQSLHARIQAETRARRTLHDTSYPASVADEITTVALGHRLPGDSVLGSEQTHVATSLQILPPDDSIVHDCNSPFQSPCSESDPFITTSNSTVNFSHYPLGHVVKAEDVHLEMYNQFLPDSDRSMLRLIKEFDKKGIPRTMLDDVMKIISEEIEYRGFVPGEAVTRKTIVQRCYKLYANDLGPIKQVVEILSFEDPTETRCKLEDIQPSPYIPRPATKTVSMFYWNAQHMVLDLLHYSPNVFSNLDNLVVNPSNKWGVYLRGEDESPIRDELLDGDWYVDTVASYRREKDFQVGKDFVIPLVLYVDKTGTDAYQRYPLEPLTFTFGIFKRKIRNLNFMWRPLGLIPDLEQSSSKQKSKARSKNKAISYENYHRCLYYAIRGLRDLESNGLVTWIRLGDEWKKMRIFFPVAMIMGDGKSGDMICTRKQSYKSYRISRSCKTHSKDCDRVSRKCEFISKSEVNEAISDATTQERVYVEQEVMKREWLTSGSQHSLEDYTEKRIRAMGERKRDGTVNKASQKRSWQKWLDVVNRRKKSGNKRLKKLGAHPVVSAFDRAGIHFGWDIDGVYGCCPVDTMHAINSGIMRYVAKLVVSALNTEQQARLDGLVDKIMRHLRSGEKSQYPRLNFGKGFSNLTLLTSSEWVGMIFALSVILKTKEGKEIFESTFKPSQGRLRDKVLAIDSHHAGEHSSVDNSLINEELLKYEAMAARYENNNGVSSRANNRNQNPNQQGVSQSQAIPSEDDDSSVNSWDSNVPEDSVLNRLCSTRDVLELLEALLSFHAWFSYATPHSWTDEDQDHVDLSIRRLIVMIRVYLPRKAGNGWKLQKIHDILHLVRDINKYGSVKNFDCCVGEKGLVTFAKLPGSTSQQRGSETFQCQVSNRLNEATVLNKARLINGIHDVEFEKIQSLEPLESEVDTESMPENLFQLGGSSFVILADASEREEIWLGNDKLRKGLVRTSPLVAKGMNQLYNRDAIDGQAILRMDTNGSFPLPCYSFFDGKEKKLINGWRFYTECELRLEGILPDSSTTTKLRCHPNYQNEGPFYDWVAVNYGDTPTLGSNLDSNTGLPDAVFPAKLIAFLDVPDAESPLAIIHCCEERSQQYVDRHESVLTSQWKKESVVDSTNSRILIPVLAMIDVRSIVDRLLVVEENPVPCGVDYQLDRDACRQRELLTVHLVKKRLLWCKEFVE